LETVTLEKSRLRGAVPAWVMTISFGAPEDEPWTLNVGVEPPGS
jgi:hypothetical protein